MKRWWLLCAVLALTLGAAGGTQAQNARNELLTTLELFLSQRDLAIQQASLSAFSPNVAEAHQQARTALNIAVGQGDASFDTTVPNLGDGVGLTGYVRRLNRAFEAAPDLEAFRVTWDNIRFFVTVGTEQLKLALRQDGLEAARRQIRVAQGLFLAARGTPGDLPSRGGVRTLMALVQRDAADAGAKP